mmetsp:Transcript_12640/g.24602  ORF Transcript_12640/g.24602 Transcript_12640/m.24602 type:complete len:122 (+) Transcript_12640:267-632(+)
MFDAEVYGSPEAAAATAAAKDEGARMFILLIVFEPPVWLEYLGHAFGTHCSQKEAWHKSKEIVVYSMTGTRMYFGRGKAESNGAGERRQWRRRGIESVPTQEGAYSIVCFSTQSLLSRRHW